MPTLVVTGGAGFIGCNFVRFALSSSDSRVVVLDKLTYAGNLQSLADVAADDRFHFVQCDIADHRAVREVLRHHRPSAIVNFAAESHVDRSIEGPRDFIQTNIVGVFELLEASLDYLRSEGSELAADFRFLQISTDEVYGTLGETGRFSETTPYSPNSPYAASKASADHLVRAYHETYGLPALITNCSNNYGPYQFPEKLIPLMILSALEGLPLPIYGDGLNVRDWLHVEDHCRGIWLALRSGRPGEKYNIGGHGERNNLQVVDAICTILEELSPADRNAALASRAIREYAALKTFVTDRPGHDRRYAIDSTKIREELGWQPRYDFEAGLRSTVQWYLDHRGWCEAVRSGKYRGERLGLAKKTADP
ncbi:MAG: dTDP-glucose 4,6-dehydratase [Planctomycetes bacterium]|nr:dTDP-glucose 4,6-dehydratase [Planctomycetota bacterium]